MVDYYKTYVNNFAEYDFEMISSRNDLETYMRVEKKPPAKFKFIIKGPCCDKPFQTTWTIFKNKPIKQCTPCSHKLISTNKRETYQDCYNRFYELGVILITTEEEYNSEPDKGLSRFMFKIIAKCGHERDTKFYNFEKTADENGVCINCAAQQKYITHLSYDDIQELFENADCELLTTEDEFEQNNLNIFSEIRYKAHCDHIIEEIFNNLPFKKDKPLDCVICRDMNSLSIRNDRITDGRLNVLIVEEEAVKWIVDLINHDFDVKITNEGCKADIAIKPKHIEDDLWASIQLKSASKENKNSCKFGIKKNNYINMIIICTYKNKDKIWLIKPEYMKNVNTLSISLSDNTKYSKYLIKPIELNNKFKLLYNRDDIIKKSFLEINKRIENKALEQEDKYIALRKTNLPFLPFEDVQNYILTDFMINGFKIQEKIAKKDHQQYNLDIHKSRGTNIKISYEKSDNDFYWIHLEDWRLFYVIPEQVLIDNNIITDGDNIGTTHLGLYPKLYNVVPKKNQWSEEYVFDYQNLDIDKLKNMFNLC
jgi:hypothetical protein